MRAYLLQPALPIFLSGPVSKFGIESKIYNPLEAYKMQTVYNINYIYIIY